MVNVRARVIDAATCVLEGEAVGPGYSGPETYGEGGHFSTEDGALSGGVWSYDGRLVSTNPGKGHQLWLVVAGKLKVWLADSLLEAGPGQLVLFEAPYPEKTIEASEDFRAIWIGVPRRSETQ